MSDSRQRQTRVEKAVAIIESTTIPLEVKIAQKFATLTPFHKLWLYYETLKSPATIRTVTVSVVEGF